MNEQEAMKLATWLAAAYPGRNIQELHVRAWAEYLANLERDEARDLVDGLRRRMASPPAIADFEQTLKSERLRREIDRRAVERENELRALPDIKPREREPEPEHMTLAEYLEQNPEMRQRLASIVKKPA